MHNTIRADFIKAYSDVRHAERFTPEKAERARLDLYRAALEVGRLFLAEDEATATAPPTWCVAAFTDALLDEH